MTVKLKNGFTLLEVMIVVAIIAILATIAIPSRMGAITQERIVEAVELVEPYKAKIEAYYISSNGEFPADNAAAGLPEPNKIRGNYIEKVEVRAGVLHLWLGQKLPNKLHHKILSIRPVYVENTPSTPLSWVCGYSEVPDGMRGAGRNLTDISKVFLPGRCRI